MALLGFTLPPDSGEKLTLGEVFPSFSETFLSYATGIYVFQPLIVFGRRHAQYYERGITITFIIIIIIIIIIISHGNYVIFY